MATFQSFIEEHSTLELDKTPERIVVTGFPEYDTLRAIGAEDKIVAAPKAHVPNYLGDLANDIVDTESLHEPNLQAIKSANPDFIIVSGRASSSINELQAIAPVFLYETTRPDYWDNYRVINVELGRILDKEEEVAVILDEIDEIATPVQRYNEETTAENALTVMLSEGSVKAFPGESRYAFLHQYLGFDSTLPEETDDPHGIDITIEDIQEMDPSHLFVIDRTKAISDEKEEDSDVIQTMQLSESEAFHDGNVHWLTPDLWYISGGGLQSVKLQIEEVIKALNLDYQHD